MRVCVLRWAETAGWEREGGRKGDTDRTEGWGDRERQPWQYTERRKLEIQLGREELREGETSEGPASSRIIKAEP